MSDEAWASFLREVVTPRFPGGLTFWRAEGEWRDEAGTVEREESFVLEVIRPAGLAARGGAEQVMAEYRTRFRQRAVLYVRDVVEGSC